MLKIIIWGANGGGARKYFSSSMTIKQAIMG